MIRTVVSHRFQRAATVQRIREFSIYRRLCGPSSLSYLHNPGEEPLTYATVGEVLSAAAETHAAKTAIVSLHENKRTTYEQLFKQVDALGCSLMSRGFSRGDRVGIWSHNCVAWVVSMLATIKVGLMPVAINPVYEKDELSFCLKKTGAKGLIIGDKIESKDYYLKLLECIPELREAKPGELKSEMFPELRSVICDSSETLPGTENFVKVSSFQGSNATEIAKYSSGISPDDGCIIHFTSGTTGEPKAAVDSHFGVVNQIYCIGKRNTLNEAHQTVCLQSPLFHALGSVITTLSALRFGCTLLMPSSTYSVTGNAHALLAHGCSIVTGTPTMYMDLVSWMRAQNQSPERIQVVLTAGAPCSPQLFLNIKKYLNTSSVKSLYGMTETTASVFMSIPNESMEKVTDTVGYLQDHFEVKVVDKDGIILPFGSPGELMVRSYSNMKGYWDEPQKTKEILDDRGWLRTGDVFTISADGYGRIVGREKDIIVRGGENIAPKEIEDILNTHPHVLESQVVGVSEERMGEVVCAVMRGSGPNLTLDQLHSHLKGRLAPYKIPTLLYTVEDFPRTPSGKIQKYKLKQMIDQGKL